MLSFIDVGYVWQILERGSFLPPINPSAVLKRPTMYRVKDPDSVFRTLSNICDGAFLQKFKTVKFFRKKNYSGGVAWS